MDPDEALRQIRLLIKQLRVEDTVGNPDAPLGAFRQHARDLAETVDGLDGWLTRDGFKPVAWIGAPKPIVDHLNGKWFITDRSGPVPIDFVGVVAEMSGGRVTLTDRAAVRLAMYGES